MLGKVCCPQLDTLGELSSVHLLGKEVVVAVQSQVVSDSVTPWTAAHQASLSFTISRSLLKLMSIQSLMPSNHLILCRPLLLPSIFPSIRVFSTELALRIRWPKYWSFIFSISPSSEYSGLISFRMDWFGHTAWSLFPAFPLAWSVPAVIVLGHSEH